MNEPETLPTGVHEEVALLPWYANGTLPAHEQERVAQHLESCAGCRQELEELSRMKAGLAAVYRAQPEPSPRLGRSVLRAVAGEVHAHRAAPSRQESWFASVDRRLRSLLFAPWVPTLAAAVLLVQVGLIVWISMPAPQANHVVSRGLDRRTARLSVVFHTAATEESIRSTLGAIGGRIVDGPNHAGVYTIEVPAEDVEASRNKLDLLRRSTNVVRSADFEEP